ncbi:uncharacterized protein isoform X2 [Salmo salar]|uniref:Uncharacterized protein isoform X2 n=1 Tax=Salmo salar TaxID=8030 RepID=A0ABM3ESA1_SALSA|nr:uncharacterized protein LOC106604499 isoform X2 [Salmo salar]
MIKIGVIVVLLSLMYVTQCNDVQYQTQVREIHPGDPVTLYCVFSKEDINMFWYKQMVGQKPQSIVTMTKYDMPVWHKDFNHSRFNVEKADADGMYRLAITNTDPTDEAVYYCAVRTAYEVNFINGTHLLLKGKNHQRSHYHTVVQRPVSDPVHPGDSVTLQCTVLTETCTGEHSVYWFRAGSGESHPGVIYTSGNRSDECQKNPETPSPTQSCVYSFSKNNLSLSDAGTYYCAVATCGEIFFGNGTNLHIAGAFQHIGHDNSSRESSSKDQDADTLNYAALNFSERKTKRGRKKRETPQESVYSDVRCSDWE